jgi:hypothetical protein
LIDHIPEKALSWMGAQAQSMAQIGNAEKLQGTEQLVGSYAGQQLTQNIGGAGKGVSDALSGIKGGTGTNKLNNALDKIAGNIKKG